MDPTPRPKPASPRWIALAALVILAAGLAVAARQWRPPGVPSPAAPGARSPLRDPIHVALKQAGGEDEKSRWVDDLPEVDLAALSKAKRELFLRVVNTRRCTCGCGYTLAACRIYDATCEKSLPKVRAAYDSVARGSIADATGLRERPARETAP
ncbi:MAG: hypothetical protein E6K80_03455 [Candidatus Eisenbacteria bacterium]|uniref:Uncharacterized protein n=1 Tax=Eiseniibacteriota bacterium TaxID=2212470 RepID=A0A538U8G1_UNCEI|nr:MAG: hypothetical protein E6K80_03455 [Candidatus Eisenbacteria bacterium]